MTIPQVHPLRKLAANEPRSMEISLVCGNIIRQRDTQTVVNSANANPCFGSGVAFPIHGAAAQRLYDFCELLAPLAQSKALISPGFELLIP